MRRRWTTALVALAMTVGALFVSSGTAAAAPHSHLATVSIPSAYPWEAPYTLEVNGYSGLRSDFGGPYHAFLAITAQPPTTDPIYSQNWRFLSFASHTEVQWRNTTTGASGVAHEDRTARYPWGEAYIDTGLGWVEYTITVTSGALIQQLNPQRVTSSGALEVTLNPF
ncbi:hypothetical protein BH93_20515 [Rhodococcoides fascians A25f]|uniref:hypothetical protein n=1 Tax=Nocardiaceae TaxID=85025 RepID=UPI00055DD6D7|nr:hypothetical protein [Rhodococcus fascians]QII07438.1 hypothetical protein BH93_20515 [Rhodococcus fascians A25f]